MKFAELFRIGVHHGFYADGTCADFRMLPDAATERILRNHRSLVRPTPNGLICVTQVDDDGGAFIAMANGTRLRFKLVLDNKDFGLFTDLSEIAGLTAPVYASTAGLTLTPAAGRAAHTARLTVVEPDANESFLLSVNPLPGLTIADFALADGTTAGPVNAYNEATRELRIDTADAALGTGFEITYPVRAKPPADAFAEIDLVLRADEVNLTTPAQPAPRFRIEFEPKESHWAYYCVTSLELELSNYAVIDEPPEESSDAALVFGAEQRTDLVAEPDDGDRVASRLGRTYPKMKRYRFVSDNPIACREAVRPGLRLQVDGTSLPRRLANPSYRNTTTVQIGTGDDAEEFDCVTEVVKLITEPLG